MTYRILRALRLACHRTTVDRRVGVVHIGACTRFRVHVGACVDTFE